MVSSSTGAEFALAYRLFIDAHARGMQSLREGNLNGLRAAVADECAAVEKVSAVVSEALSLPDPGPVVERHGGSDGSESSLEAEHARLFDQMHLLEREHRDLETRSDDVEAHRAHRARLKAHIAALRVHLDRLRARGERGRPA